MPPPQIINIYHHGAVNGVTGSCHQLLWNGDKDSILIDCGLFQGAETSPDGASWEQLEINFDISTVRALFVTHCHIDHVGRIPYLLAAGFKGKIYCSIPTAKLLPVVLEDAVKIGFTRNQRFIQKFIKTLKKQIVAISYRQWISFQANPNEKSNLAFRFQKAGHILGSSYIEFRIRLGVQSKGKSKKTLLFSGDLGAPYTPLLSAPKPPYSTDILVIESTYGDKEHEGRRNRTKKLRQLVEQCFQNKGTLLIPAFSIGRTQELLYELEHIIHKQGKRKASEALKWEDIDIIVDSPLAAQFTALYRELRPFWDKEAHRRLKSGRHPLSFEQLLTVEHHGEHLRTVDYLQQSGRPAIVLAASGMCSGGRIVNYLKALIDDPKTDILFVGYQAQGTPGRIIQKYGPRRGYVMLDGKKYTIQAGIHTISGYSAHADQSDLLRFVKRMSKPPQEIRIVHGDQEAKRTLQQKIHKLFPTIDVFIP